MHTGKTFKDFSSFNCFNRNNFLEKLETAFKDDPFHEPEVCRLLRLHCQGMGTYLAPNFEVAEPVQARLPIRFAEALFVVRNEKGEPLKSLDVLQTLREHRPDLRLLSRFRFWLGFASAEAFFKASPTFTHLSLNIPAHVAASARFADHFEQGVQLFEKAFPGKGLIIEMLENEPWGEAQRVSMDRLRPLNIGYAVDDWGADDGTHTTASLELAKEYTTKIQPLVKIDGALLKKTVVTGNSDAFVCCAREVEEVCPKALLVFEWMDYASDLRLLAFMMREHKLKLKIHFVQSHSFSAAEKTKAEKLFSAAPRRIPCRHHSRIFRAASFERS